MVTMGRAFAASSVFEIVGLRHKRRESVLAQLVAAAERLGLVRDPEVLLATLSRAQRLGSSALGKGHVVTHARSVTVLRSAMLLGRSERGVEWGGEADEPVQLVLLVLSPASVAAATHVDHVTEAVRALRLQRTRQKVQEAVPEAVRSVLEEAPR